MSNAGVAERSYAATHSLDTEALLAILADDFIGHVAEGMPGGVGGTYRTGPEMLRRAWAPIHRASGAMPYPAELLEVNDGRMAAIGDYRGRTPVGEPFSAASAHLLRFGDGRIVELRQITDTRCWVD